MTVLKVNPKADKILKLVAEHGFITREEIAMLLGCSLRQVDSYIQFLNDIQFVEKINPYIKVENVIVPTARMYKYLEASGKESRVVHKVYKSDFNPLQIYHTKIAIQVRLIFESHPWVLDYRPERVIDYYAKREGKLAEKYKRGMKHMDAEVILNFPKGQVKAGIEIELVQKSYQTYKRNLLNFNKRKDLHSVYWICGNDEILKAILKALKDLKTDLWDPERHLLVTWDKFKSVKFDDYIWTDVNGHQVAILPPLNSPEIQKVQVQPPSANKFKEMKEVKEVPKAVNQTLKPEPESKPEEPKTEPDQKPKFRSYRPFIPPPPEPKEPRLR